jgi:hypothetical protein
VLTPLFLLLYSFFTGIIALNEIWAVLLLVIGLLFLVARDLKGTITLREALFEIFASLFFAASYTLLHEAYAQSNFLTVFIWAKLVLIPVGIIILSIPKTRHIVLAKNHEQAHRKPFWKSKVGMLFLFGQACGGGAEMLLSYSISLATPALVNSLQGLQYVFLFIFGLLLSKKFPKVYGEKYSVSIIIIKIIGIAIIATGLFTLALSTTVKNSHPAELKVPIGITFSPRFAQELGLDPKEAYIKTIDQLKIKKIRLPVYWDEVEKNEGDYNFSETSFYLEEAKKRNIEVVLVVGLKQPRWPECFVPDWAEGLTRDEKYKRVIRLVAKEVGYFQRYENITHWQVENEAMFQFGLCEKPDSKTWELLQNEVAVVRSLDSRPILLTDSGELSSWKYSLVLGDTFGTTMYRSSWNPVLGYIEYPTPPMFYTVKAKVMEWIMGINEKPKMVAELQAEPWAKGSIRIIDMPIEEQIEGMTLKRISENIEFAQQTKFAPIYLWGVEWWYWMSLNGHPEYLEEVSKMISELDC